MQTLPYEVIPMILTYLGTDMQALSAASQVSKDWNKAAQEVLRERYKRDYVKITTYFQQKMGVAIGTLPLTHFARSSLSQLYQAGKEARNDFFHTLHKMPTGSLVHLIQNTLGMESSPDLSYGKLPSVEQLHRIATLCLRAYDLNTDPRVSYHNIAAAFQEKDLFLARIHFCNLLLFNPSQHELIQKAMHDCAHYYASEGQARHALTCIKHIPLLQIKARQHIYFSCAQTLIRTGHSKKALLFRQHMHKKQIHACAKLAASLGETQFIKYSGKFAKQRTYVLALAHAGKPTEVLEQLAQVSNSRSKDSLFKQCAHALASKGRCINPFTDHLSARDKQAAYKAYILNRAQARDGTAVRKLLGQLPPNSKRDQITMQALNVLSAKGAIKEILETLPLLPTTRKTTQHISHSIHLIASAGHHNGIEKLITLLPNTERIPIIKKCMETYAHAGSYYGIHKTVALWNPSEARASMLQKCISLLAAHQQFAGALALINMLPQALQETEHQNINLYANATFVFFENLIQ